MIVLCDTAFYFKVRALLAHPHAAVRDATQRGRIQQDWRRWQVVWVMHWHRIVGVAVAVFYAMRIYRDAGAYVLQLQPLGHMCYNYNRSKKTIKKRLKRRWVLPCCCVYCVYCVRPFLRHVARGR